MLLPKVFYKFSGQSFLPISKCCNLACYSAKQPRGTTRTGRVFARPEAARQRCVACKGRATAEWQRPLYCSRHGDVNAHAEVRSGKKQTKTKA